MKTCINPVIKKYEILFDKKIPKKLNGDFVAYDTTDVNQQIYYELSAFKKFSKSAKWNQGDLSGLFSPRFALKARISHSQINSFISENPEYDIYLFHPYPRELSIANSFLDLAELEHPGITKALKEVWLKLYYSPLPSVDAQTDKILCCHCNYFIANSFFWQDYSIHIKRYMDYLKSREGEMLTRDSSYTLSRVNQKTAPLGVFVFERTLSHFLKFNKNKYKVANYTYMTDYEPPELFDGEKAYVKKLLNYINQEPSDNISSRRSEAIKQYYNHRKKVYKIYE